MARGFVYLVAIVDWFSRKVLASRLSITLSADFCVEALEEAIVRHGKPDIFNIDQGSQFSSTDFTKVLKTAEIAISMDGKGARRDASSSSGSGGRSDTRRSISEPTPTSRKPALRSAGT